MLTKGVVIMSELGNKQVFSENLLYYMNKNGIKRNNLCEALGFPYTTVCDWINATKYPRIDRIEAIANYFGIEKSDLIEKRSSKAPSKAVKIPVLGFVRAGYPMDAVENILDYEEISEEMARSGEFFALKIQGDSMEPRIKEGDVVIVRKQSTVENGEVAVVLVNGNDATVKKFFKTETGVNLISTNSNYEPFFFSPKEVNSLPVEVIGRVVELRAKF